MKSGSFFEGKRKVGYSLLIDDIDDAALKDDQRSICISRNHPIKLRIM
jgi:hypothetical protein